MSINLETRRGEVAADGRGQRPVGAGGDRRRANAGEIAHERRGAGPADRRGQGLDYYRFESPEK